MRYEKELLQNECDQHGIFFAILTEDYKDYDDRHIVEDHIVGKVLPTVISEAKRSLEACLWQEIQEKTPNSDSYILIDGDQTLCPVDTGSIFFENHPMGSRVLKTIFQRYDEYNFTTFWEVAMLYAIYQMILTTSLDHKRLGRPM
jgi:tRNA uridine 5-carbamoylmethylation protein Kti12